MNTYSPTLTRQFPQYLSSAKPGIIPPAPKQISQVNGKRNLFTGEWLPVSLYHAYSAAMVACMSGKRCRGRGLNIARLNRAMVLIITGQAAAKIAHYHTTIGACRCEDYATGKHVCKHQLAVMLLKRAGEVK